MNARIILCVILYTFYNLCAFQYLYGGYFVIIIYSDYRSSFVDRGHKISKITQLSHLWSGPDNIHGHVIVSKHIYVLYHRSVSLRCC